jgi:DNA-binding GntR family transcriptional regulator
VNARFKSKKEVVYDQLRQEILEGIHPPGVRLVIDDLVNQIGVSQIPIREAMRQLEADGFVTIEPHVGATVTNLDASFIYEVFALLEAMEIICSRTACQVITDDEIIILDTMISEMDTSIDEANLWSQQNKGMHLFICDIAKAQLVRKMMLKVFDHWDRLRFHYLKNVLGHRIHEAQAEHKQILEAFRNRDADGVEQIVHLHNQRALQSYIEYLQSQGHLGSN